MMLDTIFDWLHIAALALVFLFIIGGLFAGLYILDALRQAVPQ